MRSSTFALLALLTLAGCPLTEAETPAATATRQVQSDKPAGETKATGTPSANLAVVTATFNVTGMTCENCSKAIETKLIGMPGVTTVSADDKSGKTIVQFDEGKLSKQEIIAAIDSLKFKATVAQ